MENRTTELVHSMQTPPPPSEHSAGGAGAVECEPALAAAAVAAPLVNEGGIDNNEEETAAVKLKREIDKAIAQEAEEEQSGIAHETVMGMKKSEWLSAMLERIIIMDKLFGLLKPAAQPPAGQAEDAGAAGGGGPGAADVGAAPLD